MVGGPRMISNTGREGSLRTGDVQRFLGGRPTIFRTGKGRRMSKHLMGKRRPFVFFGKIN